MKWRAKELPHAWKGSKKNARWEMFSTYIEAFGVDRGTIDGESFPFIHGL
jgi:hypothetical protein